MDGLQHKKVLEARVVHGVTPTSCLRMQCSRPADGHDRFDSTRFQLSVP